MYDWILNTPLEGFVEDASRKKLVNHPVVECCITNKLALSSATGTLFKNQIFVDLFLIAALRKKISHGSLRTLGRFY